MTTRTHTSGSANWLLIPLVALVALSLFATSANAAILYTDFDSLSTGAVTAADLNSVTTGGTWALSSDTNITHTIVDDGGDKAFLSDHANNVAAGFLVTATLTLDSPIDTSALTSGDLRISFDTHPEATTSFHRYAYWRFLDASDTLLFEAFAYDNGQLRFKAGTGAYQTLGTENDWQGNANFTWDADHARVAQFEFTVNNTGSVTFDENNNGWSKSGTFDPTDDIAKIQFAIDPGTPYGQGIFLNDITIVPEPASVALLLSGVMGLFVVGRRRR